MGSIIFYIFLLVILCCNCIHGEKNYDDDGEDFTQLIVAGYHKTDTSISKFMVVIYYGEKKLVFGDNLKCGGVIISKRSVLTAARCVTYNGTTIPIPSSDFQIAAGSKYRLQIVPTTQLMSVEKIVLHPTYDVSKKCGDISVLQLTKNLKFNKAVAPIPLALERPPIDTACTTAGWGRIYLYGPRPDEILYSDLQIVQDSLCVYMLEVLPADAICTKNLITIEPGPCNGDSGGPLICDGILTGLGSYNRDCKKETPTAFSDVAYHNQWILKQCLECGNSGKSTYRGRKSKYRGLGEQSENNGTKRTTYLNKIIFIEILLVIFLSVVV